MTATTKDEAELIAIMQADTADVKKLLTRITNSAFALMKINADAGRQAQANDAMIWGGVVMQAKGAIIQGHGVASQALIAGYDNGGEIVAYGPGR